MASEIKIIFIDDVGFTYGDCEDPDFTSVTCDFEEEHICGYESDATTKHNWIRDRGLTMTPNVGPRVDVSTNTDQGYFMYIDSSLPNIKGLKLNKTSKYRTLGLNLK